MKQQNKSYAEYVEHPIYGREPIYSKVKPRLASDQQFVLLSKCWSGKRIEGTAVLADMSRQNQGGSYLIKYYFDEEKTCYDCGRSFIFFAQKQKRWYEELGININAMGRRCFECRKTLRDAKQNNRRYAELVALEKPTSEQLLKMAEICMLEVKAGRFNARKLHTAKSLLRRVSRQYLDGDHPDKTAIERLEIELNRLLGKT